MACLPCSGSRIRGDPTSPRLLRWLLPAFAVSSHPSRANDAGPLNLGFYWSRLSESNRRPSHYEMPSMCVPVALSVSERATQAVGRADARQVFPPNGDSTGTAPTDAVTELVSERTRTDPNGTMTSQCTPRSDSQGVLGEHLYQSGLVGVGHHGAMRADECLVGQLQAGITSAFQPVDEGPRFGELLLGCALRYQVQSDGKAVVVLGEVLFVVQDGIKARRDTPLEESRLVEQGAEREVPAQSSGRAGFGRLGRLGSRPRSMG